MKICVLGAGVLGVTTAYELAKSGHDVTVVERQPEPARECSFANGGQLSYSHAEPWANPHVFPKLFKWMWQDDAPLVLRFSLDPHMIRWGTLFLLNCLPSKAHRNSETMLRLGLYSKQKMNELIADTKVEFHHLSRGTLHIFSDQAAYDHARTQAEFQSKLGCAEEAKTREECLTLEPTLANITKPLVGGMYAPIDESGDVHFFTRHLADYIAQKYNVKFLFNHRIHRIHQTRGEITHVELEGKPLDYLSGFDAYVMAMGSWSSIYLRQLGLYVPIYPMKGYSISVDSTDACPQVTITDDAAKQVYSKLGGRMRVAGTAEFAGYNEAVRQVRIDPLKRGLRELFPLVPQDNLSEWACLRPSTPDGPPIIGSTPIRNLYMNSGHGTLGWTQAAGSARLLADIINQKPTEIPLSGLDIERCLIRI